MASAVAQMSALLRYVVLARLLGPEQLGIAATLVLTSAFFDFISDTGSDRFLIQDRHGDEPAVQSLVQLVFVGRGAAVALALALSSWPIALFYKTPPLAVGLCVLALSPLILGFTHLDNRRSQRDLNFRPEALCSMVAEGTGLVATVIAAYLTRNFTAILYGLISRAVIVAVLSHVMAHRPYRLAFAREHAARLSRFAGPLMVNGFLLFFATQGDRALVGRQLGFATLGRYSAVLLLIYYPAAMLMRYMHAMYLPLLARSRDDPAERSRVGAIVGGQVLMLALVMSAGFALVAPFAVRLLYGARFRESALVVALIGILQCSRFLLTFPTVMALSVGRSGAALAVNVVRLAAYPSAIVAGQVLAGLPGVILGFVFGELLAHGAGLTLLNRGFARPVFSGFHRLFVFLLASATIEGWVWMIQNRAFSLSLVLIPFTGLLLIWVTRREKIAIEETFAIARRLFGGLSARIRTGGSR